MARSPQVLARHQARLKEALGPEIRELLEDHDVLELMLNADGSLWTDRHSVGLDVIPVALSEERVEGLVTLIAGLLDRELTERRPVLEGHLPGDGSRITALLPPVVRAPSFAIRKRAGVVFTLENYVEQGALTERQADLLRSAVAPTDPRQQPLNVVVAGGPGSGKTTLANALLRAISDAGRPTERLLLIEDTAELQCQAPCHEIFYTTDELDLRHLVQRAMRYRPDRIVVGEVRGGEALDLLKAWNTGTPGGIATVHANSSCDALDRLDHLAQEAGVASARRLVAASVDLVAFITRTARGRRVSEIVRVQGLTLAGEYDTAPYEENSR